MKKLNLSLLASAAFLASSAGSLVFTMPRVEPYAD